MQYPLCVKMFWVLLNKTVHWVLYNLSSLHSRALNTFSIIWVCLIAILKMSDNLLDNWGPGGRIGYEGFSTKAFFNKSLS